MRELWDSKYLPVIGYLILAIGVAFALYLDHTHTEATFKEIQAQRIERIDQLNRINTGQCREIESLKAFRREEANENYGNLEKNAKLLGIKVTDKLRAEALRNRNNIIARFKEGTCPREKID